MNIVNISFLDTDTREGDRYLKVPVCEIHWHDTTKRQYKTGLLRPIAGIVIPCGTIIVQGISGFNYSAKKIDANDLMAPYRVETLIEVSESAKYNPIAFLPYRFDTNRKVGQIPIGICYTYSLGYQEILESDCPVQINGYKPKQYMPCGEEVS